MLYCTYLRLTGQFVRVWPNEPPYDPATEAVQTYPEHLRPDLRTERYDEFSETKKRVATGQELADYDVAKQVQREQTQFDDQKLMKAVAIWTAGKLNVPLQTVKSEILAIYRGL